MPRMGRPSLSDAQAEHVRAALLAVRRLRFHDNQTAMARALGLSPPAVSQQLSRRSKPSYATAEAVAAVLGVSAADVLEGRALSADPGDRYPDRAWALAALRDVLPLEVVEQVRSIVLPVGRPLSRADWARLVLMRLAEHEAAARVSDLGRATS